MNNRFFPKVTNKTSSTECSQNNLSVSEYVRDFEQLVIRGGIHKPQEQTMARFLNRLNAHLTRKEELNLYFTLDDVCKLAFKVGKWKKKKTGLPYKVLTKLLAKNFSSSRASYKSSRTLKLESSSRVDRAKQYPFLLLRSCLKARGASNAKSMDTSNMIALIKELWPSTRWRKLIP